MTTKEIKALAKTRKYAVVYRYGYTTWGTDDSGCTWENFFVSTSLDNKADAITGQNVVFKVTGKAKEYPGIKCTDASLDSMKVTLIDLYTGETQDIIPDDHLDVYNKWHFDND